MQQVIITEVFDEDSLESTLKTLAAATPDTIYGISYDAIERTPVIPAPKYFRGGFRFSDSSGAQKAQQLIPDSKLRRADEYNEAEPFLLKIKSILSQAKLDEYKKLLQSATIPYFADFRPSGVILSVGKCSDGKNSDITIEKLKKAGFKAIHTGLNSANVDL